MIDITYFFFKYTLTSLKSKISKVPINASNRTNLVCTKYIYTITRLNNIPKSQSTARGNWFQIRISECRFVCLVTFNL